MQAHPANVKLNPFMKWLMLVTSICPKKIPSVVSTNILEIFTNDKRVSMTSLCQNGTWISSLIAAIKKSMGMVSDDGTRWTH